MAKKATLDVLDIQTDEVEAEKQPEGDTELEKEPEDGSGQRARGFSFSLPGWARRPLFWIPALGGVALVLVVALSLWFFYAPATKPAAARKAAPPAPAPATEKVVELAGFVVDLKDERGAARLIFCDAALDLEKKQKAGAHGTWLDARNIIYMTMKEKKVGELLSVDGKNRLKMDLKEALNRELGANFVSHIYFTRFEIF